MGLRPRWIRARRRPGSKVRAQRNLLNGPAAIRDRIGHELRRINDDVLDAFAVPGINDVNQSVAGLDHRRIRKLFAGWLIEEIQHQRSFQGSAKVKCKGAYRPPLMGRPAWKSGSRRQQAAGLV